MSPSTRHPHEDATYGPHGQGERLTAGTDLAARWLGGSVMAASDESFGEKENLLTAAPAFFEPGHYGNRGEIVDGWETKRRREQGHDWALVRLGTPGLIGSVDVDTSFFTGNYPEYCSVDACGCEGYPGPKDLSDPAVDWVEIVPRSPLHGDEHNTFPVSDPRRFTHLRLSAFPDGGIARLRVYGEILPDPRQIDGLTIDLVSQEYGGALVASSDGFYTSAQMLNRPDQARTMGEGWETRRRRDSGHDFAVFQLGFDGRIRQLVIDTSHFKYNASAEIAVYGCQQDPVPSVESDKWDLLLEKTKLQPDTRHVFMIHSDQVVGALRLDAFPDGGLSRLRALGRVDPTARQKAGYRWFNSLPATQALRCLADAGIAPKIAVAVVDQRPLPDEWLDDPVLSPPTEHDAHALRAMLEGASHEDPVERRGS
jgi:allantoicase